MHMCEASTHNITEQKDAASFPCPLHKSHVPPVYSSDCPLPHLTLAGLTLAGDEFPIFALQLRLATLSE